MVGERSREGLGSRPVGRALKVRQMEVLGITLCAQELVDQAKGGRGAPASYWQNGGLGRGAAPGELTVLVEIPKLSSGQVREATMGMCRL